MSVRLQTKREQQQEKKVREVLKQLRLRGFSVRREKLVRGNCFRAKSGSCCISGENVIFVDSSLPIEQQLGILTSYLPAQTNPIKQLAA